MTLARRRTSKPPGSPRLGRTIAGLAQWPPSTEMPSASTPVHDFRRTRQSPRSRSFAIHDNEVLVRRFHFDITLQWLRSHCTACRSYLWESSQGTEMPREKPIGGRCVAGVCHPPSQPLQTHELADSQSHRVARRGRAEARTAFEGGTGPSVPGDDSSCDVHRPGSVRG